MLATRPNDDRVKQMIHFEMQKEIFFSAAYTSFFDVNETILQIYIMTVEWSNIKKEGKESVDKTTLRISAIQIYWENKVR